MAHIFDINRKRRTPNIVCDCGDLTAPDGHLYTQDELDVSTISNPDGSMSSIDWDLQKKNKFRKNVWESIRTTGIGGSEVGVLFGDSHFKTSLDLYYDKIGQLPLTDAPEFDDAKGYLFDFGHKMEEFVAEQFVKRAFWQKYQTVFETKLSEKYGEVISIVDVQCVRDTNMYRCPECPCLIADFDFLVRFKLSSGKVLEGIFECKTSSPFQITEKWAEGYPASYKDQISNYMLVGDYDFAIIACAADNNFNNFYAYIEFRDEDMDKKIISVASEFWNNNVMIGKPPITKNVNVQNALLTYEPTVDYNTADFTRNRYVRQQIDEYLCNKENELALKKEADKFKEASEVNKSNIAELLKGRDKGIISSSNDVNYEIVCTASERITFGSEEKRKLLKDRPDLAELIDSYSKHNMNRSYKIKKVKQTKQAK